MFNHSVKVPRLYKQVAKVAKQVKEEGASLKDKIYEIKHSNIKGALALVSTVLKNSNALDYIIRSTQILIKEDRLDPWLARVLITELLWGKKRLPNESKPCETIISYTKELRDCLATFDENKPATTADYLTKVSKPRYVRVNTLTMTMAEAIDIFRDEGWTLLRCGDNSDYGSFLATVASLSDDQFIVDMHVKDVLIFSPTTQFYLHHLYLHGHLILQDKASCLAPLLLSPEPKSSILDMCSAPGMKASQLASMTGTEGTVYAVERDQRRYQTLVKLMEAMHGTNIKCINKDVLTITDKDIPDIEYILVDPSCSGSGMLDRQRYEDPEAKCNQSRLQSLAGFQITILRHALNNFPKAKRVVYSTCSTYPDENESVVEQVITTVKQFKLVDLRETMKQKWFNFGSSDFGAIGERCLYARPEQDYTNGFFVALFERLNDDESNEFFVRRVKRSSECNEVEDLNMENDNPVEDDNDPEKSKKKKKKSKLDNNEVPPVDEDIPEKKKKKSKNNINDEDISEEPEQKKKRKSSLNEELIPEEPKPKKKSKKHPENDESSLNVEESMSEETSKKKKKSKNNINDDEISEESKQKKKSKKDPVNDESVLNVDESISEETSKKKKKSKININDEEISEEPKQKKKRKSSLNEDLVTEEPKQKKKSKKDPVNDESALNVDESISEETSKTKKKSKNNDTSTQDILEETQQKKKKKSKNDIN